MKLVKKLALLFLPVALYFTVFVAFEPYNYFGIKRFANESGVIYRVRSYRRNPQSAIILGDSRMAHFDMDLVQQVSGRQFANLSFGGAALGESIDMFYFAKEEAEKQGIKLDTVYMGVSFYTLRGSYNINRMQSIETILNNPLAYMLNFDYNVDMLTMILPTLRGDYTGTEQETAVWTEADYKDETGALLPYRKQLTEYAQTALVPACQNYTLNTQQLQRLVEMAEYCAQNQIALTFVFPPMDESVWNLVVQPLGIAPQLEKAVEVLNATPARVLDYETTLDAELTERQFYDGFHIDTVYGLPQFTKLLFGS
ncbi:MAG: hypothetical protein PHG02_01285 [Oscillospiraceae bacterium]|nr:hypothetical protein [Oscillospiraceae bacterium]